MKGEYMLSMELFEAATDKVIDVINPTKLIKSDYLSDQTGAKVYLKPENMQHTGSYKVRGAYYKICTLSEEERSRGLVTASAGNHAQGVAYAARKFGCKATIVMPTITPLIKVNNTKSYGADVILHGDVYDDAYAYAMKLSEEKGYTFVHPFNDLDVVTGQGTIAMEIIKELPTVDIILVPVGGGGLIAGVAALSKMLNPKIQIIGVEPKEAASMKAALAAGKVVELPSANTIADGTAVKAIGDQVFPIVQEYVSDIILVDDAELNNAFLDLVENHKMIAEYSGLLTIAALKQLECKGKKVVAIISGGNMDVITMATSVQHGLIQRDRIFTISVLLPDKPGELVRVATVIANVLGNVVRLDHNQFVSTNRNAAVELRITLEAFGTDHKELIMEHLRNAGYQPKLEQPKIY